jgi:halogenation protein CepH
MSPSDAENAEVVVVGGGPGGTTTASLIAMQGHRVILLEKEKFPRYQIGESLLPSTIHGVCGLTGVADELVRAGFTFKNGGTFSWGTNPEPWTFSFSISPSIAAKNSYAYQVERKKFDQILLDHARRLGVDVREECTVTGIVGDDERVRGASYVDDTGNAVQVRAKYVVDASGNQSRLYRQVGERKYSEFFRNLAIFGYFDGGKRLPPPNSGNIICVAFESGWFWYIPLSRALTSVGAVVRRELADKVQGSLDESFRALIGECPMIREYLGDAQRITEGDYGRLRVRKDYSYHNTSYWRPGMVLIGDAACFVDPVFSSGVHLATYSALLASRSINTVLAGMMDEETAFREFELRYRREYGVFYEFLMSFYNLHVDENSYFWSAKKITENMHSELESFVDLVGGVSSGDAVLAAPQGAAQRLEGRSAEFMNAVHEVIADREQSMLPLFNTSVVKRAMREGAQIQSLAFLGEDSATEAPLLRNGLGVSGDGMFWVPTGNGGRH